MEGTSREVSAESIPSIPLLCASPLPPSTPLHFPLPPSTSRYLSPSLSPSLYSPLLPSTTIYSAPLHPSTPIYHGGLAVGGYVDRAVPRHKRPAPHVPKRETEKCAQRPHA
jgi:hypothetical protein